MPALGYTAISRPHLWPNDTLQEARLDCLETLGHRRTQAENADAMRVLLARIEQVLLARGIRLRPRR